MDPGLFLWLPHLKELNLVANLCVDQDFQTPVQVDFSEVVLDRKCSFDEDIETTTLQATTTIRQLKDELFD